MEFFLIAFIVFADQISKYGAIRYLKNRRPYVVLENFLQLNYVENRGAAFGILEHKRLFFIIITLAIIIFLSFYMIKNYNNLSIFTRISFSILIAGAAGNLIDRIRLGYVVDFISFRLKGYYNFPVFNIADTFIVISTILVVIIILFDKIEA
ncbi:signal peptidase II [Tissierella creatinophila]|uniref:Lipoprotein signal peptidase n=1 Tax=Tissierella creatinophila DSM 6911 TaxID=1123403 RepID=A0A1U7M312_TISCR|nr:signal peptidase II [Tissierella creatinophila]OLS01697.1 lipoprotein signal peptidase [Tissierella creatinophila DSM 6911]